VKNKVLFLRMRRNPFFVVGFCVVLLLLLSVIILPSFLPFDPIASSLKIKFQSPDGFAKGFSGHVLGTDELGRDVFTRLLYGGRYSLLIAGVVIILQVLLGTGLGISSGFFGGGFDSVIMRLCDIVLAIPNLILAIAIMAVLGINVGNLIFVLTFSGWVDSCKVTRNGVRIIKNQDFVNASRALGAGKLHIMFTQILPNVTTPIIILASQRFGYTILCEAALSFLNLGIQPPTPSWGNMIASGRSFMTIYPWLVFAPGIALMLCVLAFNFLGDGLRDILDPKRKR
jgi:peptide/nickel transport system permease protein